MRALQAARPRAAHPPEAVPPEAVPPEAVPPEAVPPEAVPPAEVARTGSSRGAAAPRGFSGLTHEQLLGAVPTANHAVRCEAQGACLLLWVPVSRRWWLQRPLGWFLPLRPEKGISLDRIGSEVYRACDGERSVEQIVEEFARHHQLRFHEARASVVQFLQSLVERNLLALVVPEPAPLESPLERELGK